MKGMPTSRYASSGLLEQYVPGCLPKEDLQTNKSQSALWDNRITQHNATWDYENNAPRHGTRVTSLAEKPYFDAAAPTRREALGLPVYEDEVAEI
jgi:hypothetical protein